MKRQLCAIGLAASMFGAIAPQLAQAALTANEPAEPNDQSVRSALTIAAGQEFSVRGSLTQQSDHIDLISFTPNSTVRNFSVLLNQAQPVLNYTVVKDLNRNGQVDSSDSVVLVRLSTQPPGGSFTAEQNILYLAQIRRKKVVRTSASTGVSSVTFERGTDYQLNIVGRN